MKISLESVRKRLSVYDKKREHLIRASRTVIQQSKTAIGAAHRDELANAEKTIASMAQGIADLKKLIAKEPRLAGEGIYKVAIQEYVEAKSLRAFLKGKFLPYVEEFEDPEYYLLGLCDLSGELVRKAINASITDNYQLALSARDFLEKLHTELSKFDLRNGELRRKYDGIKYDRKKLDDIVFNLKMKDKI